MGTTASVAIWFIPLVIPISIWVAYSDLSRMKIPNVAVLALMATFIVLGLIALPFAEYWPRLIHFFVVLLIGFLMTMTGLVGAGDAKFAAAMAPFFALSDLGFTMMLFAGTAFICIIAHRIAKRTPLRKLTPNWESWARDRDFPMGLPLAATLTLYLVFAATA